MFVKSDAPRHDTRSLQAGYACPAPTTEVSDATKLQQRRRVLSGPLTTAFDEPMSKRRRGYPSETRVKRGDRGVQTPAGFKDFEEKLGRNDLCPCGSGKCFQEVLPAIRQALTAHSGTSIAANDNNLKHKPGLALGFVFRALPAASTRCRNVRRQKLFRRISHDASHARAAILQRNTFVQSRQRVSVFIEVASAASALFKRASVRCDHEAAVAEIGSTTDAAPFRRVAVVCFQVGHAPI